MGLDANGIWQYTEGETASLASTLWNRLAASVSTAVAAIKTRATLLENGATYTFTPTASLWGQGAAPAGAIGILKRGTSATLKGAVVRTGSTTTATSATVGNVPTTVRPPSAVTRRLGVQTSAGPAVLSIAGADGAVVVTWAASVTLTQNVTLVYLDDITWETT